MNENYFQVGKIVTLTDSPAPIKLRNNIVDSDWEEEFEDNIDESWFTDNEVRKIFKQYKLSDAKIKIKCKKGTILIEKL